MLAEKRLAEFALFRGVPPQRVARLLRASRPRELATGQRYASYGSRVPGFPFLLSGALELSMQRGSVKRIFRVVLPGDSFCEAMALLRAPNPFDVIALEKAEVLAVAIDRIEELAERDKTFDRSLRALLARRVIAALGDLDVGTLSSRERLITYLASLARPDKAGTWHAVLPVTKTILAARLGMKKETLSRALRGLVDEGLIGGRGRELTVVDRDRLLAARLENER